MLYRQFGDDANRVQGQIRRRSQSGRDDRFRILKSHLFGSVSSFFNLHARHPNLSLKCVNPALFSLFVRASRRLLFATTNWLPLIVCNGRVRISSIYHTEPKSTSPLQHQRSQYLVAKNRSSGRQFGPMRVKVDHFTQGRVN